MSDPERSPIIKRMILKDLLIAFHPGGIQETFLLIKTNLSSGGLQFVNNSTLKRSPFLFFVLVYVLSIPLWVFNVVYPTKIPVDNLPVTDIVTTFSPMVAGSILVYREEKLSGVKNLLKRAFDYIKITEKVWYAPIIFLMPFIYVLTYVIMLLIGLPVPTVWNPPLQTPLIFIAFFLAAAGEELGYSGYVTDPMQVRYTALNASLIIGLIHAVWHFPSMLSMGMTPGLFIWGGFILAFSFRILTVWLYNNTGKSVFAAILFHAVTNTGRSIFPGSRSTFQL